MRVAIVNSHPILSESVSTHLEERQHRNSRSNSKCSNHKCLNALLQASAHSEGHVYISFRLRHYSKTTYLPYYNNPWEIITDVGNNGNKQKKRVGKGAKGESCSKDRRKKWEGLEEKKEWRREGKRSRGKEEKEWKFSNERGRERRRKA